MKAGLRTWEDHLVRIQGLHADFASEMEAAEAELKAVGEALEEDDKDDDITEAPGSTLQEKLLHWQVGKRFTVGLSSFFRRNCSKNPSIAIRAQFSFFS